MYWNYGLTEDFTSIQKTIGILNAIDFKMIYGWSKVNFIARQKRSELRTENENWICLLQMKLSEIWRMLRPGNIIFKCWFWLTPWFNWRVYM